MAISKGDNMWQVNSSVHKFLSTFSCSSCFSFMSKSMFPVFSETQHATLSIIHKMSMCSLEDLFGCLEVCVSVIYNFVMAKPLLLAGAFHSNYFGDYSTFSNSSHQASVRTNTLLISFHGFFLLMCSRTY